MLDIFNWSRKKASKDVAKERLKLLLIHDRVDSSVSPKLLEELRSEIIQVIKKHLDVDEETLDIQLTTTESSEGGRAVPALVANIPIRKVR